MNAVETDHVVEDKLHETLGPAFLHPQFSDFSTSFDSESYREHLL